MKPTDAFTTQTLRDFSQIDLALNGNQQAYQALFKRYWRQLFFAVQKMVPDQEEARDVTIEAFSKAFGNLHRFRKEYGFNTWLYRIAINHSLDHKRKKRLSTTPLSTFATDDTSDYFTLGNDQDRGHANPEEQVIGRQNAQAIQSQLGALPSQYREVARLRFVDAYSYVEIADMLQMPMGTVKARIHRARCLLRQSLLSLRNQL
jgi:RNA polymerase sigma-70 factor (ECF subfamily)